MNDIGSVCGNQKRVSINSEDSNKSKNSNYNNIDLLNYSRKPSPSSSNNKITSNIASEDSLKRAYFLKNSSDSESSAFEYQEHEIVIVKKRNENLCLAKNSNYSSNENTYREIQRYSNYSRSEKINELCNSNIQPTSITYDNQLINRRRYLENTNFNITQSFNPTGPKKSRHSSSQQNILKSSNSHEILILPSENLSNNYVPPRIQDRLTSILRTSSKSWMCGNDVLKKFKEQTGCDLDLTGFDDIQHMMDHIPHIDVSARGYRIKSQGYSDNDKYNEPNDVYNNNYHGFHNSHPPQDFHALNEDGYNSTPLCKFNNNPNGGCRNGISCP